VVIIQRSHGFYSVSNHDGSSMLTNKKSINSQDLEPKQGDFTVGPRLLKITATAVLVGLLSAIAAWILIKMIDFFTNLFYFQRFSFTGGSPADSTIGWFAVLVPIVGGLVIGLMARYGSDRIRGHGIPEAIETILIGRARMSPKLAILKPLSSAISIGSGGPFGAEGPIVMTGGSIGSIIAQALELTSAERKTLLVAGAAGGMSAIFNTPVAAVLLAVELLLFEWKPRSLIPVSVSSIFAMILRSYLFGPNPMFAITPHATLPISCHLTGILVGLIAGFLSLILTMAVYAAEDGFHRLPIHWMWWPAVGGVAVGVGGLINPAALGVGYANIEQMLSGNYVVSAMISLLLVKGLIWSIALGSGTSGGVLAPLLIMGGAVGALEAGVIPWGDKSLWPLVSMAAVLGGTMRSPLTGVVFALELTRDIAAMPTLLMASTTAYGFTVLVMKRSILTEKIARRGYHLSREYSVDPLERIVAKDVMTTEVESIPAATSIHDLLDVYFLTGNRRGYPVVDKSGSLLGVITRSNLLDHWIKSYIYTDADGRRIAVNPGPIIAYDLIARSPITAFPTDSCRVMAERMAVAGVSRLPVVDPDDPSKIVGIVTINDLLKARLLLSDEEIKRERFLGKLGKKTIVDR
jgi:CIC family chloride channel protein